MKLLFVFLIAIWGAGFAQEASPDRTLKENLHVWLIHFGLNQVTLGQDDGMSVEKPEVWPN